MRKLLTIIFFFLFTTSNSFASGGVGDLKLSDNVISNFQKYLSYRKPVVFLVTTDGQNSVGWKCPYSRCVTTGSMNEKKLCSRRFVTNCEIFALRRSVKWKNSFSKNVSAKDKKFSSKDSIPEIKSKLILLGFLD